MKPMLKAALMGTLAAGLVMGACSPFGGASIFNCEQDSQCSPNGMCKQPEGLCVFPSDQCASGQEYGGNSGSMSGKCVGDDLPPVDAPIDAPTMCVPNSKTCFNHAVETCKAEGDGFDPALKEQCALTCSTGATPACTGTATNIALTDQQACNATGTALSLSPAAGATVVINQADITCAPACNGGGTTTIPRTSATPNHFYCLAAINIPSGVTITVGANVTAPVTLFSHGAVIINSNITFDGGNATGVLDNSAANDVAGVGGPGGSTGGAVALDDQNGNAGGGNGTCGGRGGTNTGAGGAGVGGGGGGGGNGSIGGTGGDGINAATGGTGGTAITCSSPELKPLVGGAGGGGGADGACGGGDIFCGWPGGGGGGALHVVSRSMISGTGTISASGGNGFGVDTQIAGGAGGGGAGGGILFEAPMLNFTGTLRVNGGNGGRSRSQATGGAGAAGAAATGQDGPDAVTVGGGTGGGGGAGRIRFNGTNATTASCTAANASPAASCSTGTLRSAP
jgi:hypothetical protein